MVRKLAKVAVAVVLLGNGAAFAAASGVDENAPLSIPFTQERMSVGGSAPVNVGYPTSVSEAAPFTFSAQAMDIAPERLGASYAFPSAAVEHGSRL
jgi:hypothetical protein